MSGDIVKSWHVCGDLMFSLRSGGDVVVSQRTHNKDSIGLIIAQLPKNINHEILKGFYEKLKGMTKKERRVSVKEFIGSQS